MGPVMAETVDFRRPYRLGEGQRGMGVAESAPPDQVGLLQGRGKPPELRSRLSLGWPPRHFGWRAPGRLAVMSRLSVTRPRVAALEGPRSSTCSESNHDVLGRARKHVNLDPSGDWNT